MKLRNKKTGEIFDYREDIMPFGLGSPFPKSLAELCENWEDYEPKEPLIKDKKIRKIVRGWAECCGFSLLKHYFSEGLSCFICTDEEDYDYCLDFNLCLDNLEYGKIYTITELCGEEEE